MDFFDEVLKKHFGDSYIDIYKKSSLLQYLKTKTTSVKDSSKSRANLANLYAIFVLVEDYIKKGFDKNKDYKKYDGANFSVIFTRQRELPFGEKLQNHGLNSRCNEEFRKFFPNLNQIPIKRDLSTKKYWVNEDLLLVDLGPKKINISKSILDVISSYVSLRGKKFELFLDSCIKLQREKDVKSISSFITQQLNPNVDARVFEIVSFCILRSYYLIQNLQLFKTGRVNANDGGIDMVMRPIGRFFQVSEVLDFKKYFLDIDKILHFPITFVIKSENEPNALLKIIEAHAKNRYDSDTLKKYMAAIEEIISIPTLTKYLNVVISKGKQKELLDNLILYYKVEFNIQ